MKSYGFEVKVAAVARGYVVAKNESEARKKILSEEWEDLFDVDLDGPLLEVLHIERTFD